MLDAAELAVLARWCRAAALSWQPLGCAEETVLLLEPRAGERPWQRMRLCAGEAGYRLHDAADRLLAAATDLPALLDALDGGIADATPAPRSAPLPA